jgi:hypothetical protein
MIMDVDWYPTDPPTDVFEPDVILPAQHFPPVGKLAPEQRLMMAVLDDAVRCVASRRLSTDTRHRRLFAEARRWMLAEEADWPYSFESICAVLDLDANAVRQYLRLAPKQLPEAVSGEKVQALAPERSRRCRA